MSLLEFILKEYISIVEALERVTEVENNRIIIDREYFKSLLEKYAYLSFKEKTKIYKELNLIIHDESNYTMPCKDKLTKKATRKVVINYSAYLTIKTYLLKKAN